MAALPDANNHNLAPAFHSRFDKFHRLLEFGIQTPRDCLNFCELDFDDFAGSGEIIHFADCQGANSAFQ